MRLFLACVVLAAAAQAATISTTLTVTNAAVSIGASGLSVTGPATLTGIGNGTFMATAPTSAIGGGGGTNISAPFTITLSNGTDTITGTLTVPLSLISGQSGTGSATVTGGTGAFAGATGSFTSLAGTAGGSLPNITLSFTGSGTIVTGGPPTPVITAVLDAGSYTPGVAQGEIFVIKGTGLSASGFTSTTFPLPTTFGGVTITFKPLAGGTGTNAPIVYLYNQGGVNQLAAVVPSTLSPGTYNVTVTNNNGTTSANFATTVVARKPEIITQDSTGNGLSVIQNFVSATTLTVNRYTTGTVSGVAIAPAVPGQTEILWIVGMGAVPGGTDNSASPVYDFTKNGVTVQVVLGGTVTVTPFYAGRAPGLVGVDQVNFTLPSNSPTGCTVSVQVIENGVQSQPTTYMSIAPSSGANACVQPGFTTAQLQNFDNGATFTTGGFNLFQFSENVPSLGGNVKLDESSGAFTQYSGFELASIPPTSAGAIPGNGTCIVTPITTTQGTLLPGGGTNLDAGKVTLNGPPGSNINNAAYTETDNTYSLNIGFEGANTQIPGSINGTIVAGTYMLAGSGGKGVNVFNANVTLGTPLNITGGLPTSVSRGSDLMINWTGGLQSDLVEIIGSSTQTTGGTVTGATFVCFTTAGQQHFTVLSSILSQLPAGNSGFLGVISGPFPTAGNGLFNFTLASDGSSHQGAFTALVGAGTTASYQ